MELMARGQWPESSMPSIDGADPDWPHPPWLRQRPAHGPTRSPGDAFHRRWRPLLGRSLRECPSCHSMLGRVPAPSSTSSCPTSNIRYCEGQAGQSPIYTWVSCTLTPQLHHACSSPSVPSVGPSLAWADLQGISLSCVHSAGHTPVENQTPGFPVCS